MTQMSIKEARRRLGWNQERLAEEIGVTRRTVVTYETKKTPAPMLKLINAIFQKALKESP